MNSIKLFLCIMLAGTITNPLLSNQTEPKRSSVISKVTRGVWITGKVFIGIGAIVVGVLSAGDIHEARQAIDKGTFIEVYTFNDEIKNMHTKGVTAGVVNLMVGGYLIFDSMLDVIHFVRDIRAENKEEQQQQDTKPHFI